jgi:hypothetical protein
MFKFTKKMGSGAAALLGLALLSGADGQMGCGQGLDNRKGDPGIDVGGVAGAKWQVNYGTTMTVEVKGGAGGVSRYTLPMAAGGTFKVENITVDLKQMCARGEIACPQDVFPAEVTMTQPGNERHLLYVTYQPKGPLAQVGQATLLGNVDSDDDFSIALGIGGAGAGNCGLLGVSYATGRLQPDLLNSTRAVALTGEIVTAYSGGCAVAGQGGAVGAGVTVELRLPFTGTRKSG